MPRRAVDWLRAWGTQLLLLAILLAVIFGLGWRAAEGEARAQSATAQRNAAAQQSKDLAERVADACKEDGEAGQELRRQGACQQASRVAATPVPKPTAAQGRAPSPSEIADAVRAYCAGGRCAGKNGRTPSAAQVAAAVSTFCTAHGKCAGPEGKPGDKGDVGAQGDPPSAEQVSAAVTSFCAANGDCRGPKGDPGTNGSNGTNGTDGRDGRGIQSMTCQDDGTWLITYTDGTEQTADGPCRVGIGGGNP